MERPERVALAIWFHDLIYDGVNKQDEDNSAEEFERFGADLELEPEEVRVVSKWIRLTASHSCSLAEHGADCCLFMDMDMAILGKRWAEPWEGYSGDSDRTGYCAYALGTIIEEYRNLKGFPEWLTGLFVRTVWCFGRASFLTKTAEQSPFITEQYKQLYGPDAAQNMRRELQHWKRVALQTKLAVAGCIVTVLVIGYRLGFSK